MLKIIFYQYTGILISTKLILKQITTRFAIALLVGSVGISSALPADTAEISGTISLPGEIKAPAGNLNVQYRATNINNLADSKGVQVVILAGQSESATATLTGLTDNAMWRVNYACDWNSRDFCRQFLKFGYYDTPDTNWKVSEADLVTPGTGSVADIDMTIVAGVEMSGSLTMPSNIPHSDFDYNIFVFTPDFTTYTENTDFTIASGTDTGTFRVTAPDDASLDYNIRYQCKPGFCADNYPVNGYFDSGSPGNTTNSPGDADDLPGNTPRTDLHMSFLTGTTVEGTISLPSGTATENITVLALATDASNGNLPASNSVTLQSGDSSKDYSINVTDDADADWIISYFCNSLVTPSGCAPYFERGYYDKDDVIDSTTDNINEADSLMGGVDHMDIDLTLLTASSISGEIFLENGTLAPTGGLEITVSASNTVGGGVTEIDTITIDEGTNSAATR